MTKSTRIQATDKVPAITRRALSAPSTAHLIKWAEMAVRSRLEAALRPFRLSSGQLMLLVTLDREGEATAAELARALHITPQAMTTLLKPLAERALLHRRQDERNRQRVMLSISAAGEMLLASVRQVTPAVDVSIAAQISREDLAVLHRLLIQIAQPSD